MSPSIVETLPLFLDPVMQVIFVFVISIILFVCVQHLFAFIRCFVTLICFEPVLGNFCLCL